MRCLGSRFDIHDAPEEVWLLHDKAGMLLGRGRGVRNDIDAQVRPIRIGTHDIGGVRVDRLSTATAFGVR